MRTSGLTGSVVQWWCLWFIGDEYVEDKEPELEGVEEVATVSDTIFDIPASAEDMDSVVDLSLGRINQCPDARDSGLYLG